MGNIISSLILIATLFSSTNLLIAQWVKTPGLEGYFAKSFAVSGTSMFVGTELDGIIRSTDNGTNWNQVNNGVPKIGVASLVVSNQNIFAGIYGGGVFFSNNNGTSWTRIDTGLTYPNINTLFINGSNLFVGLNWGEYVYMINNKEWTWSSNYWYGFVEPPTVLSFASNDSYLFAGTFGNGVFLLNNNMWNSVNTGLTNKYVSTLCANDSNLFVGTTGGIFLSTDNGNNWNAVNNGLDDTHILSLLANGSSLFAGTYDGIFLSTNNGTNWNAVNTGLSDMIYCLIIFNSILYAGTDVGVWQRPLSEIISGVIDIYRETPLSYILEQNYPNPFNPSTTIRYALPTQSFVTLKVYNILGQEITTLVSGKQEAGFHYTIFQNNLLPSGVYYYNLSTGEFSETKKLILIR
jgi:hypothetical protein